jgi:CRISPR-associated endonuclease Cas3-HD
MMSADRSTTESYNALWAKSQPRHPLWKHLLDAAAVSLALGSPLARQEWTDEQVALIVGLHDIGKADAGFQHQVPEFSESLTLAGFPAIADARCRHERLSGRFVRAELGKVGTYEFAAAVGRTVLAHHGYWNEGSRDVAPEYANAQEQIGRMLERVLGVTEFPKQVPNQDLSNLGMRLAGHIVLSDWIASNEQFFTDSRLAGIENPEDYFQAARCVAKDWVSKLDFDRDNSPGKPASVVGDPRPVQRKLLDSDVPPGLRFDGWRADYGIGFRLIWNLVTTVSFDYGISSEGADLSNGSRVPVLSVI